MRESFGSRDWEVPACITFFEWLLLFDDLARASNRLRCSVGRGFSCTVLGWLLLLLPETLTKPSSSLLPLGLGSELWHVIDSFFGGGHAHDRVCSGRVYFHSRGAGSKCHLARRVWLLPVGLGRYSCKCICMWKRCKHRTLVCSVSLTKLPRVLLIASKMSGSQSSVGSKKKQT